MNEGDSLGAKLWRWCYVLWVSRVALLSVAVAGFLLAYTVQARDLFADLALQWWQWLLFLVLVFAWAWVVHASARNALQHDDWVPESHSGDLSADRRLVLQRLFFNAAVWLPRLLGIAVFFVVGFAIFRVRLNFGDEAGGLPEAAQAISTSYVLLVAVGITALLYVALIWKRRRFNDWTTENGGWSHEPPLLAGTAPIFASIIPPRYERTTPQVPRSALDKALSVTRLVVIGFLLVTIAYPHILASQSPRLFFVPILLGGATVLLAELAAWSMRWRTPLLLGLVAVSLVMVLLTESFHDTRWVDLPVKPSKAAGQSPQISMVQAVDRWKAANDCAAPNAVCPRPILIAGAGGASRAGFYTATVVGALMDLGHDKHSAPYGDVRSRIFALSTVSGSSAAAAVMRAALLDAASAGQPNQPPCKTAGTGSWFGLPLAANDPRYDPKKNWRDCFQAVLAGDFLSPIMVALAYRDNFPFINPVTGRPAWSDRAVLLEQALERRYHRFVTDGKNERSCPDQPKEGDARAETGLCRPFGYLPDPQSAGAWIPLFFINGASVFTGRRIVVGDVATTDSGVPENSYLRLAYDLNELRKSEKSGASEKRSEIRLSTAATMSARFPIISPQGVLRNLDGKVKDQIVDGGYFENDGLATIADIAAALKSSGLDPVVIHIVNEPSESETATDRSQPPAAVPVDRSIFDDIFAIARALVAARSGHEDQYAALLKTMVGESHFYEIGVHALGPAPNAPQGQAAPPTNPFCRREITTAVKMERVSMSWWMSQPVQAYLDAQLCMPENWTLLECELRQGRTSPGGDCPDKPAAATDGGRK